MNSINNIELQASTIGDLSGIIEPLDIWECKLRVTHIPTKPLDRLRAFRKFIFEDLEDMDTEEWKIFVEEDVRKAFVLTIPQAKGVIKEALKERKARQKREVIKQAAQEDQEDQEEQGELTELYEKVWLKNLERFEVRPIIQNIADYLKEKLNAFAYKSKFYVYDDGIYKEGESKIKTELSALLREINYTGRETDLSVQVLHCIEFSEDITEYPFNKYSNLIPVQNGIVKIDWETESAELVPFSPEYKFNYKIDTAYNPEASTERIEKLLKQYDGDAAPLYQIPAQAILQALGHAPFKKAHLLQGHTNAGKSSFLELLFRTIGHDQFSHVSLQELTNNRFKLASFEGRLFNVYDDLGELPMSDCGKFKNLTGSFEHEIERKGKQSYPAILTNVQLYTCNNAPMLSEQIKKDAAFWERWEFVEFSNRFETDTQFYDREFTQEVQEGFLLKIIETVIKVHQDNKLLVTSDSGEVREKWFSNSDPVFQYLEACTFSTPESVQNIEREALLESFTLWCNDNNIPETKRLKTVKSFTSGVAWYGVNTKKWDGLAFTKAGRCQGTVFVCPFAFRMNEAVQKYKVDSIN